MASAGAGALFSTGELIAEVTFEAFGEAGGLDCVGARLRKVLVMPDCFWLAIFVAIISDGCKDRAVG